ncbi:hypothetical protein CHUAL_011055 [Chamberlinius hualienensis]
MNALHIKQNKNGIAFSEVSSSLSQNVRHTEIDHSHSGNTLLEVMLAAVENDLKNQNKYIWHIYAHTHEMPLTFYQGIIGMQDFNHRFHSENKLNLAFAIRLSFWV